MINEIVYEFDKLTPTAGGARVAVTEGGGHAAERGILTGVSVALPTGGTAGTWTIVVYESATSDVEHYRFQAVFSGAGPGTANADKREIPFSEQPYMVVESATGTGAVSIKLYGRPTNAHRH